MDQLATPEEVAKHLRVTAERLANDRYNGIGPKYIKYGRSVRYRWVDIHDWEMANLTGDTT